MPSKTPKMKRTMAAAAHDPAFAKKMGISQSVAKEFNRADAKKARGFADGGPVVPGNIDLTNRPVVKNPDGTISTVRTIGINVDGKETVIPTVSDDGRVMSNDEARDQFRKTGKHFGQFGTRDEADAFAQQLHLDQANLYKKR